MNTMKSFSLIAILLATLPAQSWAVSGRAVNAQHEPLENVQVILLGKNLSETTTADGLFDFSIATAVLHPQHKQFDNGETACRRYTAYDLGGRQMLSAAGGIRSMREAQNHLIRKASSGQFIIIREESATRARSIKALLDGGRLLITGSQNRSDETGTARRGLYKAFAVVDSVRFVKDGYTTRTVAIESYDAALGDIVLTTNASGEWVSIFDGTMNGWHTTGGARWWIEDGAICGTQKSDGVGGFIFTDKKTYKDFELEVDVFIHYGHDSGIHMRDKTTSSSSTTGDGYQACVDYFSGRGTYCGFYYKGPSEKYSFWETTWPYRLCGPDCAGNNSAMDGSKVTKVLTDYSKWKEAFNANDPFGTGQVENGGWNTVKVRIEGDPPLYNFWINGLHTVKYQADKKWTDATQGMIGFQVINNTRRWPQDSKGRVKYKNIRVREL